MTELRHQACEACRTGAPQVSADEARALLLEIPDWAICTVSHQSRLVRDYSFADFAGAMAFTRQVAEMAEQLGHHPEITTAWGSVRLVWYTHKIGGLHRNDFICAARSDAIYETLG